MNGEGDEKGVTTETLRNTEMHRGSKVNRT